MARLFVACSLCVCASLSALEVIDAKGVMRTDSIPVTDKKEELVSKGSLIGKADAAETDKNGNGIPVSKLSGENEKENVEEKHSDHPPTNPPQPKKPAYASSPATARAKRQQKQHKVKNDNGHMALELDAHGDFHPYQLQEEVSPEEDRERNAKTARENSGIIEQEKRKEMALLKELTMRKDMLNAVQAGREVEVDGVKLKKEKQVKQTAELGAGSRSEVNEAAEKIGSSSVLQHSEREPHSTGQSGQSDKKKKGWGKFFKHVFLIAIACLAVLIIVLLQRSAGLQMGNVNR